MSKKSTLFHPAKLIISFMFFISTPFVNAQPWVKTAVGLGNEEGRGIATDATGNVYLCGFYDQATTMGTISLTSVGLKDVFLAKYDNTGNLIWVRTAGSTANDIPYGLVIDSLGNIIVAGTFGLSITFGTTVLTSAGGTDLFVVKYNPAGTVLWAKGFGGTLEESFEEGSPISKDTNDNLFITGDFTSTSLPLGSFTLTNANTLWQKGLVFKLNSSGNVVWANQFASNGSWVAGAITAFGEGTATDKYGNCYVVGDYAYGGMFGMPDYSNAENSCLLKYDNNGNFKWAQPLHSPSGSGLGSIMRLINAETDVNGNVYLNGWYITHTINIGGITLTNNGADGISEAFIAKYDSSGAVKWTVSFGGAGAESLRALKLDGAGNVWFLTNSTSPTISFGSFNFTCNDSSDIYVVKLNSSNGSVIDAYHFGKTGYDAANGIALIGESQLFIAGTYSSPTLTFGSNTLNNSGSRDMFIAKLGSATGLSESNNENSQSIYPNPFTNELKINLSANKLSPDCTLSLFDINGKEILSQKIFGKETILNTENITSGFYLLRFSNANSSVNYKVVKP